MPLDPSIFYNFAALNQRDNENLVKNIGNSVENSMKQKQFDKQYKLAEREAASKGLDLEKLASGALIKQNMGQNLAPEEMAALKAFDTMNMTKLAQGPDGNYRRVNASIFGSSPQGGFDLGAAAAPTGFVPGQPVPSVQSEPLPDTFIGGTNLPPVAADIGANPNAGMVQDDLPTIDPNSPYAQKTQELGGFNLGALPKPAVSDAQFDAATPTGFNLNATKPRQPIQVPPELAGNPNAAQKYLEAAASAEASLPLEVAKVQATEGAKADAKNQEKLQAENDTLPILSDMLKQNAKTNQLPYASVAQPLVRFANPEQGNNMDLLKQNRLDMAAPLAKQLGVNPTDKDFQATLDRIFDETASGESRNLQIQNLINKIERRQGKEPTKFNEGKKPMPIEGKKVRQKSTGKTGTIVNGEFVPD